MSREFSLFEHRIEAIMGELAARGACLPPPVSSHGTGSDERTTLDRRVVCYQQFFGVERVDAEPAGGHATALRAVP
jgi:hypothetical protein